MSSTSTFSKLILITGGTKGGLGYEVARQILAQGHRVILSFRDASKAKFAVDSLIREGASGERVGWVQLDLMNLKSVCEAGLEIGQKHASIDVLMVRILNSML